MQINIKPALLELFEDEEIKSKVLEIVKNEINKENNLQEDVKYNELISEINKLKNKKESIEKEVYEKDLQIENIKNNLENARSQLENAENELKNTKNQLQNTNRKIEKYKMEIQQYSSNKDFLERRIQPVNTMLDLWERIQSIPEKHKIYFNELSGAEDMMAYFSVGRDMRKLQQLQRYIQDVTVEDMEDEVTYNTLNDLLCFCIDISNYSKSPNEKLRKIYIDMGKGFDDNICVKTSSSKNTGYISQVLVQGFCDQEGKIVFKNIVKLS